MNKVLLLDIETSPNVAYVWKAWKENISDAQMIERGGIICYAAKWLNKDEVWCVTDTTLHNEKQLLLSIHKDLDEAEIVITHNGKKFDIPYIFTRMAIHGIAPPSPFRQVDTYLIARKSFKFMTNRLSTLAKELNVKPKLKHSKFPGFSLWAECLKGNLDAWNEMREYNIGDVKTLEEVYLALLPYIDNHPHVGADKEGVVCPKCGSDHIQWRGFSTSNVGIRRRRFQCQSCGGWGRSANTDKEIVKNKGRNA